MNLLNKYNSLPAKEKFLFFQALALSLAVKGMVLTLPMRWYSRYLVHGDKTQNNENSEEIIKYITRAVSRSSRYAPWSTKCLVDAITAKLLLRWNGVGSILYLGVHKENKVTMTAHAWLKCNEKFITGKRGYQKFVVVSSFA